MRNMHCVTAMVEKHGSDPWLYSFREAWLRSVLRDFACARQLCGALRWYGPRTIVRLATGYADLEHGRYEEATRQFQAILEPEITLNFLLHWYCRMNAHVGLGKLW